MKVEKKVREKSISFKSNSKEAIENNAYDWWNANSKEELCKQLLSTATFLKTSQEYRQRQASVYARLYGNMPLYSFIGSNISKMDQQGGLPADRPTFNLVQSTIDTLVSKLTMNKPTPFFLTDNSDYKERNLAKKLNNFVAGEFYQAEAYEKGEFVLRDALVTGTGCFKGYRTQDDKVGLDRVLLTELSVDPNEAIYGKPRSLYQYKLVDRSVLQSMFPEYKAKIDKAEKAYADNSADSSKTISDLVMVVEAWHLKSGKDARDGRHSIVCSSGTLHDDKEWSKDKFPFVFMHYSPRMLGFWSQGVAEQLMGTQMDLNSLLYTMSKSIKLAGVPKIFVETGSKVNKAAFNNEIGTIVEYQGTKPSYETPQCNAPELYMERDKLIQYGFQQVGVSMMQAASSKPAGLNSGEAIRTADDIANDRFAALQRRYNNMYVDLAYLVTDIATDIAKDTGTYKTVYPHKNGAKEIDLPKIDMLKDDPVIQCYDISSLPKDPAGRMAKITEMIQAGMISIKEGRRLLDYPDLEQVETLANASQERIYQVLDEIVESGTYTPPDAFMDLELANQIVVQYYNLYVSAKLEEEKQEQLRTFFKQIQDLKKAAMPPMMPPGPTATPQALPEQLPTSPLIPNAQ